MIKYSKLLESLSKNAERMERQGRYLESDAFDSILKSLAMEGKTFEQGLYEGLDSVVVLLGNANDMSSIREITEYIRDVRDNIRLDEANGEVLVPGSHIETPEELEKLMAFE